MGDTLRVVAYTEAEIKSKIATLEAELLRAEDAVTYENRSASYRPVEQTQEALAYWKGLLSEVRGRGKAALGYSSKGF